LLARGGDPDLRNSATGETPLVRAILGGGREQVRILLAAGADPGAPDSNGATPLHAAGALNAGGIVLELLEAGAPAHATNSAGETFQPYYFQMREDLLNERARGERQAVRAWLRAHAVPLEAGSGGWGRKTRPGRGTWAARRRRRRPRARGAAMPSVRWG